MRTSKKYEQYKQLNFIMNFVCRQFKISKADLTSERRFKKLVEARFVVAYSAQMINPEISDETIGELLQKTRWTIWKMTNTRIAFMYHDNEYSNWIHKHVKSIVNAVQERLEVSSDCFVQPVHLVTLNEFEGKTNPSRYFFKMKRHENFINKKNENHNDLKTQKKQNKRNQVKFRLTDEQFEFLNKLSESKGTNQSETLRNILKKEAEKPNRFID